MSLPEKNSFYKWLAIWIGVALTGGSVALVGVLTAVYVGWVLPWQTYDDVYQAEPWRSLNARNMVFVTATDFQQAEGTLKAKIKNPSEEDAGKFYYLLGSLYELQYRNKEAAHAYQKALDSMTETPLSERVYEHLTGEVRESLIKLAYLNGHPDQVRSMLKASESIEPDQPLAKAVANASKFPDRADFHLRLAQELHHDLYLEQSRTEYQEAIRLSSDPQLKAEAEEALRLKFPSRVPQNSPEVLYLIKAGDYAENTLVDPEKAARIYQQIVSKAPDFEWGLFHLAQTYRDLGKHSKAIELSQKALKLNPNYTLPYLLLGEMAMDEENYQSAIDYYRKALPLCSVFKQYEDSSLSANIENQLGYAYEQLQDPKQAVQHYLSAMTILDQGFKNNLMQTATAEDMDDFDMESSLLDLRGSSDDYLYAEEALERLKDEAKKLASSKPS